MLAACMFELTIDVRCAYEKKRQEKTFGVRVYERELTIDVCMNECAMSV